MSQCLNSSSRTWVRRRAGRRPARCWSRSATRSTVDQPVLELETDKATIEVPSDVAGKVKEIKVKAGDKVKPGQAVLTLDNGARRRRNGVPRRDRRRSGSAEAAGAEAAGSTDAGRTRCTGCAPEAPEAADAAPTKRPQARRSSNIASGTSAAAAPRRRRRRRRRRTSRRRPRRRRCAGSRARSASTSRRCRAPVPADASRRTTSRSSPSA